MSQTQIAAVTEYFANQEKVLVAYLFGSHARERATPLSDVDFAVLFSFALSASRQFDRRLEYIDAIQGILHVEGVDVVVLNQAPLALKYRVFRDGKLLSCKDDDLRIYYQAETVSRYLDFKPYIDRHEKAILDQAKRGELLNGYNPHRGTLEDYRQLRIRLARTGSTSAE